MKKVDVRFVCATNRDPWKEVQEGRFREDLYYRLYVIPLHLPPLREREEDVIEIAYSLLGFMSHEEGKSFVRFAQDVIDRFIQYEWPGNVRQLQNVLRNVVVLNQGKEIELSMLPPPLNEPAIKPANSSNVVSVSFGPQDIQPLWKTEKTTIEQAIEACDGNIPQAAKHLDVSPSTIYRKIQAWNASEKKA
jgi:two-component system repressor protein LuxO